ncbi:Uncharacterized conserved protein [Halogranum gelatinilyticum]|uniref:Uncharacterized conserved protein n=1 Tax=Halogranum gelatinilyticum TaxID=660521 RepID=A0A1G9X3L7_9EURY|nr:COG1361 S-layer family protein [Halogranum gelatinilyticum]SDM91046.1 Uncharacterized conserved protein [Halogranum gelatinilyticum]
MSRRLLAVVLVVSLLVASVPAVAEVEGSPRIQVTLPQYIVGVGDETTLRIAVTNDADLDRASTTNPALNAQVTTARGVTVEVRPGDAPVSIETGRQSLGGLPDGAVGTAAVDITVDEDARPGTYRLPVVVRYSYAESVSDEGSVDEEQRTKRARVTLRIEDRPRFAVGGATTDLQPGSTGLVTVEMENVGRETARDARVSLTSTAAGLTVDGAPTGSRYVGTWASGETRQVSYVVTASESVRPQPYSFEVTTTFTDADGRLMSTGTDAVGVTPLARVPFALADVRSDLAVGERGTLDVTVVNEGDRTVYDAVVHVESSSPSLTFPEPSYPVGTLAAGERMPVGFRVDVPRTAESGPRSVSLTVTHETEDGNARTSEPLRLTRPVGPEVDRLAVEPVNATFDVDSGNRLAVRLTNVGDEPLSELDARLLADAPFTSDAPTSYVASLAPGESATVYFELTVSEDAVANTHAVVVNVTGETIDDDPFTSGPHAVAVSVVEPETGNSDVEVLGLGIVVVLVVLGAGWWWLRR